MLPSPFTAGQITRLLDRTMHLTADLVKMRTERLDKAYNILLSLHNLMAFYSTGSGTYDDPISFATATDNQNLSRCAIVYVPLPAQMLSQ